MTEFIKSKFSVPLGGKAFSEGYDRAFKKKKYPTELSRMIEEECEKIKPILRKQRKGKKK